MENKMFRFNCDYLEGAHPKILERLIATNEEQTPGYGEDTYTASAKEKIKEACACPDAKVYFLVGGTQTNVTVLDSLLKNYEGVLSADTGHINVHEAGAVELTGHKVLTVPAVNGKLCPKKARAYMKNFYNDVAWTHMVRPGAMYISHPSEYGTLYTEAELMELRAICDEYGMKLFLDGARLGFGLAVMGTDVTLPKIAKYCDAFYIGGTKIGALFGEAVVFTRKEDGAYFFTEIKQHGALLAKGRLLGVQFDAFFTDGLYMEISQKAVAQAMRIRRAFEEKGYRVYIDSPTNQQFFIISEEKLSALLENVVVDDWGVIDEENNHVIRVTTSWATKHEAVDYLISLL
jgi:threonine aldolase